MYDLIIVGGGAAGLSCAIAAAAKNKKIMIIEANDRVGKKILSTGNGKCNLSNSNICFDDDKIINFSKYINATQVQNESLDYCYNSDNQGFADEIIKQFDYKKAIDFFNGLGVMTKNKEGYIYPRSEQASCILDALRFKVDELGVDIISNEKVKIVEKKSGIFVVNNKYKSKNLLLATGGAAAPKTGSDGSGYLLAKEMGHKIINPGPALTGLICEGNFKSISGVRCDVNLTLEAGEIEVHEQGNLQLTNYGLSGIPVFQLSRWAFKALEADFDTYVIVDFVPEKDNAELVKCLESFLKREKNRSIATVLSGIVNKKLAEFFVKACGYKSTDSFSSLSKSHNTDALKVALKLVDIMKEFRFKVLEVNGFDNAQVSCGGVDTKDVNPHSMESLIVKNLYFAGELLDVDGICGGYNLHFAWATGNIAGNNIK